MAKSILSVRPGACSHWSLIFLGVGFFLYVVGNFIQFLVEGRIRYVLGRRKLDRQINKLKNHYIICGYGRMGRALARFLIQRYLNVVVIEQNQARHAGHGRRRYSLPGGRGHG